MAAFLCASLGGPLPLPEVLPAMTQRVIPIESPRFIQPAELTAATNLATLFTSNRPLALEIGCGIGDFMVQLAARHPDTNFLAIDIYNQGCLKTCRRLDAAGLDNVRVMRIEARQLLVERGTPGALTAVYINCPDPWPKKRHRGRRLLNVSFLQMLLYFLKPQGELFFATDFADYAEGVAELLPDLPGYANLEPLSVNSAPADYPVSKYMRRFLDRGEPIHFLRWQRRDGIDVREPAEVQQGFRIRWGRAGND